MTNCFALEFLDNISTYIKNPTIQIYLDILGIDKNKFSCITIKDYGDETKKLVRAFLKYPTVLYSIHQHILTNVSSLDFLTKFSPEQLQYITSLDIENNKLIACAGSGKTRSIIGKIRFIISHNLIKKENVFVVTFSKHAAEDFKNKVKTLFPDYANFCNLKNFSTIDSLAKSILLLVKSHKSNNVEILSIAFRNFLEGITTTERKIVLDSKNIQYLFIDEAQDLNEVQFDILTLLQKNFGTKISLVGDPNQNIYQFRRSSSTYLMNFPYKQYNLTKNFRSTVQLINFSEDIKPIQTSRSVSATGEIGHKVIIISKQSSDVHKLILQFIKLYKKDLSNIAIICPTRGIGTYNGAGLSVFFNFLKLNNIPFNQLYDESGCNNDKKKDFGKILGHINLITYHGTKGLEFDVVFVMDFNQFLFNIKPTDEEHNVNQYLLYVAASRAISLMFVCTYTNMHEGYLNHWITKVDPVNYFSDSALKIPHLTFRDKTFQNCINGITELLSELTDSQLNMIDDMLEIKEDYNSLTRRIYKDFTHIDRKKDEALFGIFCEELFYLQYNLSRKKHPRKLPLIQMMIDSKFIVIDNDSDLTLVKNQIVKNKLTWEIYDLTKHQLNERLCKLIEKYFHRDTELEDFVVCNNEFVHIVELNMTDITKTYKAYLNPTAYQYNYLTILNDFFYLIVVQYAYDINHYYYLNNHGADKAYILENGAELFNYINKFVETNYYSCDLEIKINVLYPKLALCGEIDFIEKYTSFGTETIVDIKCTKELSIKYYIQLILYNFCYYYGKDFADKSKSFYNKFKILNLLTGMEHSIIINISPTNMFNLLIILSNVGNLKFNCLNLVYDLEATNLIQVQGPFLYQLFGPRIETTKKENKFYAKIYPEIIEIAVKDYDTGMILIDTLVKPNTDINIEVQKLTGISNADVATSPDISTVRLVMEKKMKNFVNCKMMAHNGINFDNKIMLFDKLVDPQNVVFCDTLNLIPIHMPTNVKLCKKNLKEIYQSLFHKDFNAHRAMSDVNALIEIMKFLKIKF